MTGIFRYLVIFLVVWLGYKYIKYVVGILSNSKSGTNSFNKNKSKPKVENDPSEGQQDFEGGEYIEYEEVKE